MNKNKNTNTREANIYNKSFRLLMDKDIVRMLDDQKHTFTKLDSKTNSSFEKSSKDTIRTLLLKKDIPVCWVEPLYNTVIGKSVDTPLGDGIHLDIDGVTITRNTAPIYISEHIFSEGDIPRSYSIVISRNVSNEDLKNFIKDFEFYLQDLQSSLKLPEDPPIRSKVTLYALAVIRMRDEEKKSFEEIATFISDAISLDEDIGEKEKVKILKMVSTSDNVRKNLYDRFKKKHFRLKNSHKK